MPEIEIRPAISSDIHPLMSIDHSYTSNYVWQMEIQQTNDQVSARFRKVHLPRSVRVKYPRAYQKLPDEWTHRSALLVAILNEEPVGYISMDLHIAPLATWVTDLVVERRLRRQGIGSALVLAAREWAKHHDSQNLVLEMQPKNFPMIQLALKYGFYFCGYNDRYYQNGDIAIFFAKPLR
jgi:GNAT superfamily N-acetyltransferase